MRSTHVWSLSDMLREVDPEGVVKAISLLASEAKRLMISYEEGIKAGAPGITWESDAASYCFAVSETILASAQALNMIGVQRATERLRGWIVTAMQNGGQLRLGDLKVISDGLGAVVVGYGDELDGRKIFAMTPQYAHFYSPDGPLFGQRVEEKFPKAREDIEEAGMSLATGRYTACVFHLMRAAETAVAVLGNKLKATVKNQHGETLPWGVIVANMEPAIKALPKGSKQDKWWKIHSLLHSANRAYRTKTAHPADKYTDVQAEAALYATRSFMQEFAELLGSRAAH